MMADRWGFRLASTAALLMLAALRMDAQVYTVNLSGAAESPPNASPGTGFGQFTLSGNSFSIDNVAFSGLLGTTTASHIHCCTAAPFTGTAGVATTTPSFPGFPLGVTSGSYTHVFDLGLSSSYNPAFITANGGSVTAARDAFVAGLNSGNAYYNIHTQFAPGGEVRGFVLLVTPEPASLLLLATGLIGIAGFVRRRTVAREGNA